MILANVDWLSISITLLLIVFVITALLMSLLILMQRPKQEGLGAAFGSGMTDQMFGARTTNVLQRGTVYLGSLFFILTITLAILYARKNERQYSMRKDEPVVVEEQVETVVEEETPVGSLEDELESSPVDGSAAPAAVEETDEGGTPADSEAPTEAPTEDTDETAGADAGDLQDAVEEAADDVADAADEAAGVAADAAADAAGIATDGDPQEDAASDEQDQ